MSRTCVECKWWVFDPGHPRWSDVTPGDRWSSACQIIDGEMGVAGSATLRSHWHLSGHEVTEDRFRQCLARAEQCCDFQPASHVSKNFTRDDGRSYAVPEWVLAITTPGDILTLEMADEPKWYVNGNRVIGPR